MEWTLQVVLNVAVGIIAILTAFYYVMRWFIITDKIVKKDIPKLEKEHKSNIEDIKEKLDKIFDWVFKLTTSTNVLNNTIQPLAESKSPIEISDKGVEINEKIDGEKILIKYKDRFFEKLNFPFQNNYQIQKECLYIVSRDLKSILNAEEWNNLEEIAYKEGVGVENFYTIFQILLRDMAIKENNKIKAKK